MTLLESLRDCLKVGLTMRMTLGIAGKIRKVTMRWAVFDVVGKSSRLHEGGADDVHDARDCLSGLPESQVAVFDFAGKWG